MAPKRYSRAGLPLEPLHKRAGLFQEQRYALNMAYSVFPVEYKIPLYDCLDHPERVWRWKRMTIDKPGPFHDNSVGAHTAEIMLPYINMYNRAKAAVTMDVAILHDTPENLTREDVNDKIEAMQQMIPDKVKQGILTQEAYDQELADIAEEVTTGYRRVARLSNISVATSKIINSMLRGAEKAGLSISEAYPGLNIDRIVNESLDMLTPWGVHEGPYAGSYATTVDRMRSDTFAAESRYAAFTVKLGADRWDNIAFLFARTHALQSILTDKKLDRYYKSLLAATPEGYDKLKKRYEREFSILEKAAHEIGRRSLTMGQRSNEFFKNFLVADSAAKFLYELPQIKHDRDFELFMTASFERLLKAQIKVTQDEVKILSIYSPLSHNDFIRSLALDDSIEAESQTEAFTKYSLRRGGNLDSVVVQNALAQMKDVDAVADIESDTFGNIKRAKVYTAFAQQQLEDVLEHKEFLLKWNGDISAYQPPEILCVNGEILEFLRENRIAPKNSK